MHLKFESRRTRRDRSIHEQVSIALDNDYDKCTLSSSQGIAKHAQSTVVPVYDTLALMRRRRGNERLSTHSLLGTHCRYLRRTCYCEFGQQKL